MKRLLLIILSSAIPHLIDSCYTNVQPKTNIPIVDIAWLEQEAEEDAQELDTIQQDDTNSENYLFWGTRAYLESPEAVLSSTPQSEEIIISPNTSPCARETSCIAYFSKLDCLMTTITVLFAGAIVGCFKNSALAGKNADYSD